MSTTRRSLCVGALAVAWIVGNAGAQVEGKSVAVFNFQMTSQTPDWEWLGKGLADRMATDFSQSRSLRVTARDEMQLLARELNWVPEMATTDAERMGKIRLRLRIQYLVSGVYRVAGDTVTITAQVVEVQSRREVYRKSIAGRASGVLPLARAMSAQLLAWLTNTTPQRALAGLPVWTRSLPATKALYEGMHRYDQGRYAEAWLYFRRAAREDPGYVESAYWVGKMYYFLNRYRHARRALESFVYLGRRHPRLADALQEYLHSYERTGASAADLISLYADFQKRFGDSHLSGISKGVWNVAVAMPCRTAVVLGRSGRHREAAAVGGRYASLHGASMRQIRLHRLATGESIPVDEIARPFAHLGVLVHYSLQEDGQFPAQQRWRGNFTKRLPFPVDKKPPYTRTLIRYLLAPSGHVFQSIRIKPVTKIAAGHVIVAVTRNVLGDVAEKAGGVALAKEEGVLIDNLPPLGFLQILCQVTTCQPAETPDDVASDLELTPVFAKLGEFGSLEVHCANASRFRVTVDGKLGRWNAGKIGLLSPGRHAIGISCPPGRKDLGPWTGTVTVEAGKTHRLQVTLPWEESSPWAKWSRGAAVPRDYPGYTATDLDPLGTPDILLEKEAVRLVWSYHGDLWSSVSTDGTSLTAPKRLALPVSTGWSETRPRCLRDETGRYVLTFRSDRDAQHRPLLYICWSRDFCTWSAPALVVDHGFYAYDIVQDRRGRYLLAGTLPRGVQLFASRDGFRWQEAGEVPDSRELGNLSLLKRQDGSFDLVGRRDVYRGGGRDYQATEVWRFHSNDPTRWPGGERILSAKVVSRGLAAAHHGGRTVVGLFHTPWGASPPPQPAEGPPQLADSAFFRDGELARQSRCVLLRETAEGPWEQTEDMPGIADPAASLAWNARWGYAIAWVANPRRSPVPCGHSGPYLIHGPSLDKVFEVRPKREKPKPPPVVAKPKPPRPPRTPTGEVGELAYRPHKSLRSWYGRHIEAEGKQFFHKPPAGSTSLTSRAIVFRHKEGRLPLNIALDFARPEHKHPSEIKLDLTPETDFSDAVSVKRTRSMYVTGSQLTCCHFDSKALRITHRGRTFPIHFYCQYHVAPQLQRIIVRMSMHAEGTCRFGERVYKVELVDATCNLHVDDPVRPTVQEDRLVGTPRGDHFYVYAAERITGFAGNPVVVDGAPYRLEISPDGSTVKAVPFTGPTGKVAMKAPAWQGTFFGPGRYLRVRGGREPVHMPAGKWILHQVDLWSDAQPGPNRSEIALGENYSRLVHRAVEIVPGKTASLPYGPPIIASLDVTQKGDRVEFLLRQVDQSGTALSALVPSVGRLHGRPAIISLVDSGGKEIEKIRMSWGDYCSSYAIWRVPPGFRGQVTARVTYQAGQFETQCKETKFTVR